MNINNLMKNLSVIPAQAGIQSKVIQLRVKISAAILLFFTTTSSAWSCAVCFGNASADLKKGFFWGILLLLLLPPAIITVITTKIVLSIRHKKSENI